MENGVPDTYLEVNIGSGKYMCHLDTGCHHRIIPRNLILSAEMQPASVRATAANGTEITILGQVRLGFSVLNLELTADLLMAKDVDELILGYDWLRLQGVNWNFQHRQLTLHSVTVPLTNR